VYFGLYQIASPHRQFDAIPGETAHREPGFFAALLALFRRLFL
jgi:hypothetical protein